MYYPYFRGKQFELLCIKENAGLFKKGVATPIIEPVKQNISPLIRTLVELNKHDGTQCLLVVNPTVGELRSATGSQKILDFLKEDASKNYNFKNSLIIPTFIVSGETSIGDVKKFLDDFPETKIAFVNLGFLDHEALRLALQNRKHIHIFDHEKCSTRYRSKFSFPTKVILKDGFTKRQANQEYSNFPDEFFSESNITYLDEGFSGFSDYLNVGRDFSDSGGPAYSIAIHLTWADQQDDGVLHISHYVSKTNPKLAGDVAGKFYEALSSLMSNPEECKKFLETKGFKELKEIFENQDFKGLGYLKKLTMLHHIETVIHSISQQKNG